MKYIVFDHDGTLVNTEGNRALFYKVGFMLKELRSSGHKLYVWTARNRFSTVEFLKSLGIISEFEDIFTSSDGALKPNPQGLEQMLFGVDPKDVWVVGDSLTDIYGALNFNANPIGVVWAYQEDYRLEAKAALQDSGALEVFSDVESLLSFLK